jgi:hypothetical protein
MFGLISPLISLFAGGLPRLLDIWQDSKDKKHELSIAQMQMTQQLELQKAGFVAQKELEEVRLDEIKVQSAADVRQAEIQMQQSETTALYANDTALLQNSSSWVKSLNASVRPMVTYIFVFELVAINAYSLFVAHGAGLMASWEGFKEVSDVVFSETEMVMLMDIVMFWFGSRAFSKK